jgi:hypothetical protein
LLFPTSEGWLASGSCAQKVDPACRCRTIAVTASVMIPVELTTAIRLPACSANRAAVCGVTATASVPAGSAPAA